MTQSQIDHQKLSSFVNRLNLDISKEAEYLQAKIGKAKTLVPNVTSNGENAKLRVKDDKGVEHTYDIPILTGKLIKHH